MNSPIRLILKWAGPDRKYLIAAVVFAFVSGLMAMVPYYGVYEIMKAAYEGTCTWEVITSNALVVAVGVCIQYACFGCAGALSHKGAYNTLFRVRCRVVDHLAHAPLGQLDERSTGSIKTVLSDDIEKLELFLAHNITEAIMYLTGPVAAFIFLCSVNVPLALATLVPFAAAFVVMGVIFKRMAGVMPRASAALSRMNAVMVEYVRGMRVIKALNMGSKSFRRFQSAVDEERKALGRRAGVKEAEECIRLSKAAGITNLSLDLMIGIPGQTVDSLRRSIDFCVQAGVMHISAYLLKIEEGTAFARRQEKLALPDEDAVCDFYEQACESLSEAGFRQYEISNFAQPGFESRHNLKYWNAEEYLGLGASAHSFLEGKRFFYPRDIDVFLRGAAPVEDGEGGGFEEYAMLRLRLTEGLREDLLSRRYGYGIPDEMRRAAQQLAGYGLLEQDEGGIRLTRKGFLLSNAVIAELLYDADAAD